MEKYLKSALTQTQAEARVKLFPPSRDNISYDLFLKTKKGDTYEGSVTTSFELQNVSSDFFFEWPGTQIHEIVVNGAKLETSDNYESLRDKRFLHIPPEKLQKGKNEVKIRFSNLYANDGKGLHSFTDTDGKQYVYSKSEPYAANKIFPCFDQPDLKAALRFIIANPKDWVPITNEPICEETTKGLNRKDYLTAEEDADYDLTAFKTTPVISTYLYVFIAGPYKEIKSDNLYKGITMSCYCRESLLQYMQKQAEEVFDITRETVKFYEQFFDYPYPFRKYDSIFCPEFSSGAMENPGAITFNDIYVWREQVTADKNTQRSNTITHEAAHNWFGDLVTMKWWNDLWLNESFADFISHFCLYKIKDKVTATKFTDPWLAFFSRKGWGYREDQMKSTHPIAGDVVDTNAAGNIFDGITYSKGAATLKQLMSLIGEENFSKAMASYFKKFEWSNSTLNDFISSLDEFYKPTYAGSPASLSEWKAEWLQTAGLNQCIPLFNPEDHSKEAKLVIIQSAALEEFPTLRHHKMQIAFFDSEGHIYEAKHIMLNNTQETTITYDGSKQPKAVFLNYQDEAFIKVRLDQHSIAFLKEKVTSVPDEFTRAMIWRSVYDMVRDGILPTSQYVDFVIGSLARETSDSTLGNILRYASFSVQFCPKILRHNVYEPKLFDCVLKVLLATDKANSNRIVLLKEFLITFAAHGDKRDADNLCRLAAWLDGTDQDLKAFELDLGSKWSIVRKLHRYAKLSDEQKHEYFKKVAALDTSDRMKKAETRCEALRADENQRKKLFESYLNPENSTSVQMLGQSMEGYTSSLRTTDADEAAFFDHVLEIFRTRNDEFAETYYYTMFPQKENFEYYLQRIREIEPKAKAENQNTLVKLLRDSIDDISMSRKGYLCSAADIMKEFLNISI